MTKTATQTFTKDELRHILDQVWRGLEQARKDHDPDMTEQLDALYEKVWDIILFGTGR